MLHRAGLQLAPEVIAACTIVRQGSVIRDVDVCFTADHRYCITPAAREQVTPANNVVRIPLPLAIITSQTCDVRNAFRMATRPFLTVARVFDARLEFDAGSIGNVKRGKIGDLIPLTGADFTGRDELWVADLRFECTIERGILVGKEHSDGFSDEEGRFRFQRSLSAIRGRNAIDDRVREHILKPLDSWLRARPDRSDLIEEIRIRALPTLLEATSVELYFLIFDDVDPAELEAPRDALYATLTEGLPAGLQLIDVSIKLTSTFTRADEIGTERLDLDDLSEPLPPARV